MHSWRSGQSGIGTGRRAAAAARLYSLRRRTGAGKLKSRKIWPLRRRRIMVEKKRSFSAFPLLPDQPRGSWPRTAPASGYPPRRERAPRRRVTRRSGLHDSGTPFSGPICGGSTGSSAYGRGASFFRSGSGWGRFQRKLSRNCIFSQAGWYAEKRAFEHRIILAIIE